MRGCEDPSIGGRAEVKERLDIGSGDVWAVRGVDEVVESQRACLIAVGQQRDGATKLPVGEMRHADVGEVQHLRDAVSLGCV